MSPDEKLKITGPTQIESETTEPSRTRPTFIRDFPNPYRETQTEFYTELTCRLCRIFKKLNPARGPPFWLPGAKIRQLAANICRPRGLNCGSRASPGYQ